MSENNQAKIAELEAEIARLRELAITDELSGILNRRGLLAALEVQFNEVVYQLKHTNKRRSSVTKNLSLIFIDIDNFKTINSTYGHEGGDVVIRTVAQAIRRKLRGVDVVGRYGGEELLIGLVGAAASTAADKAEELRRMIAATVIDFEGKKISVTISCGVTSTTADSRLDKMIALADQAAYRAKANGRNKVMST